MKAEIYRPVGKFESWRPCCPVDTRGPIFPDWYRVIRTLDATSIEDVEAQCPLTKGDVVLLGDGDSRNAYVAGPLGCELFELGSP